MEFAGDSRDHAGIRGTSEKRAEFWRQTGNSVNHRLVRRVEEFSFSTAHKLKESDENLKDFILIAKDY